MVPEKSCKDLGTAPDPIYGTAEDNGCYPLPGFPGPAPRAGPLAPASNLHRLGRIRPVHGAATLVRPVFE